MIEHNLDILKCSDWIIDLGLNGGDEGGYIISEGTGAYYNDGFWYGSLQNISESVGYWLVIDEAEGLVINNAIPITTSEDNLVYELHFGNNLLSYPFSVSQSIDDAIDIRNFSWR